MNRETSENESVGEADELNREMANKLPRATIEALLQGAQEMIIDHGGEEYRLRITSKGRLILTK